MECLMKYARLVVLGVAVGAGVLALRMVMNNSAPQPQPVAIQQAPVADNVDVLVASRDILLGSKLNRKDLEWVAWPQDAVPKGAITKANEPAAGETYTGHIAKAPIYDGEPIRLQRLINTDRGFMAAILPKGMRAIAVGS